MSDFLRDKPQNATPDLATSEQAPGSEQAQVSEQPQVELVAGADTSELQLQAATTSAPDSVPVANAESRPKSHLTRKAKWFLALALILLTASLIGVNH